MIRLCLLLLAGLQLGAAAPTQLYEVYIKPTVLPGTAPAAVGAVPAEVAAATTKLKTVDGVKVASSFGYTVSVRADEATMKSAAVADVISAYVPTKPVFNQGPVSPPSMEGAAAMQIQTWLQNNAGVNGTGIKVGVIADSYAVTGVTSTCAAANTATVLSEGPADPGLVMDEGRAIMEIICNIAPGVSFYFWSGANGEADLATGILELLDNAGVNIIVDDVYYVTESMLSPGPVTVAVEVAKSRNVLYVGAAGNQDSQSFVATANWVAGPAVSADPAEFPAPLNQWHAWDGTGSIWLPLSLASETALDLYLQWDEPFSFNTPGVPTQSNIDMYLCPTPDLTDPLCMASMDSGNPTLPLELRNAFDQIQYSTPAGAAVPAYLAVNLRTTTRAAPLNHYLKFYYLLQGAITVTAPAPAPLLLDQGMISPHVNTPAALAVGAVYYELALPTGVLAPEQFTSSGGVPMFLNYRGSRLATPVTHKKPDVMGPDGVDVSFALGPNPVDTDGNTLFNEFGTSMAAANVAGLAVLRMALSPGITPDILFNLLRTTARDMGPAGWDALTGYGFVDGSKVVALQCATGTPCNDNNPCTVNDVCDAVGNCVGTAVVCNAPPPCHTAVGATCGASGCQYPLLPVGTACSDGNACTLNDACNATGVCVGTPLTCASQPGNLPCKSATGTCNPVSGNCTYPNLNEGGTCETDATKCTSQKCVAGTCTLNSTVVCGPPPSQCHQPGVCNATTGVCNYKLRSYTPISFCDTDNNPCTLERCDPTGKCVFWMNQVLQCQKNMAPCQKNPSCNITNGACIYQIRAVGEACNSDNNLCTLQTCNATRQCVFTGKNKTCSTTNQCATSTCAPATGACVVTNKPAGTSCQPTQPGQSSCISGMTCSAGVCSGGTAINNGQPCNDGTACTDPDYCSAGKCMGSPVCTKKCYKNNVWYDGTCKLDAYGKASCSCS